MESDKGAAQRPALAGSTFGAAALRYTTPVSVIDIRRTAIVAMFSDDVLMEQLVLKGGNALDLVHGLTGRGSLDIDFSIEGDFDNLEEVEARCFRALRDRFDSVGLLVFDEKFLRKPSVQRAGQGERWGGYRIEFKLLPKEKAARLGEDLAARQRNAEVVGYAQEKVFSIEISKFEFCPQKERKELDDYTIYVYPLELIAAEKLRAICQQMPGYLPVRNKRARARDFYDIHTIVTSAVLDMSTTEFRELVRGVFAAKEVPLPLLGDIRGQREFHRADWPAVVQALTVPAEEYDFYFDFLVSEVDKLEPMWHE